MPLKFSQKRMDEVPTPNASGRINQDLVSIKNEMAKLAGDMVLEIETGSEKAVRSTKVLITKAAKELDTRIGPWRFGRCAIVTQQDLLHGSMEMFEVLAGRFFDAIQIYRTPSAALAWLVPTPNVRRILTTQ